jgi:hypothetical protein
MNIRTTEHALHYKLCRQMFPTLTIVMAVTLSLVAGSSLLDAGSELGDAAFKKYAMMKVLVDLPIYKLRLKRLKFCLNDSDLRGLLRQADSARHVPGSGSGLRPLPQHGTVSDDAIRRHGNGKTQEASQETRHHFLSRRWSGEYFVQFIFL